jgi:hypothetical protein
MACAVTVTPGVGLREPWPNAKTHHRRGMNNLRPGPQSEQHSHKPLRVGDPISY